MNLHEKTEMDRNSDEEVCFTSFLVYIYIIVCYNDNDMTTHHDGGDGLSSGKWVRTYVLLFIYLFILTCVIAMYDDATARHDGGKGLRLGKWAQT